MPAAGRVASALFPAVLLVLSFVAFLPVLQNGFVDWDDKINLVENRSYRGLAWAQLRWMFTTFYMGHYQPLSWLSFALDYLIWGVDPFGYHLTNLILHGLNAVIFYFLCVRLLVLSMPHLAESFALRIAAAVAALLFAVHPLRVESVAWATERRDVLSGLFFILTLVCYLRATAADSKAGYLKWMAATLAVYVLSLLSKAVGITLPIVLLVLDVYPLRRLGGSGGHWFGLAARKVWFEKLPFAVMAMGAAWLAALAQFQTGAMESLAKRGVIARIAQALYGFGFYVWKTLLPFELSPLYELPAKFNPGDWNYVLSGLAVASITWTLFFFRHRWLAILAVWLYYIVMVAPVSGILQSGPQLVADRYSYLSCLGWAILIGSGVMILWHRFGHRRIILPLLSGVVAMIIAGLAFLTWKQTQIWHDSETLFKHALAGQPGTVVHFNLGSILLHNNKVDEAIGHFRRSIELNPYYPHPYINLAIAFTIQGKTDEAIGTFREALRINQRFATEDSIGAALVRMGHVGQAITYYTKALGMQPYSAAVQNNLGLAYSSQGDIGKAIEHYRRALQIDPKHAIAYFNMGNALSQLGETERAVEHYRMAIQYDASFPEAHRRMGVVLEAQGQTAEAMGHFRRAVEIRPEYARGHYHLANALLKQNDLQAAIRHYRQAIANDPEQAAAHTDLGRALARAGQNGEASGHFREALKIAERYVPAHFNLGLLLGQMGDAQGAVKHFRQVIEIDPSDTAARLQLVRFLRIAGKADEAERQFKEALAMQPELTKGGVSSSQIANDKMRPGVE